MNQQFILIAYDISNDKRRTKLHNALLDYGTPVQYSVFECLLDEKTEKKMRKAVSRIIRPRKDHVRYYYLCAACLKKVETTGGREILSELPASIIVG
ncbi:MAG: CRISPR-associated endonuclease Cas2 [Chloroflexi bacterium]|nr:CRISPR-associated endonuclease Cas2 [Chloroflexota bacterium]